MLSSRHITSLYYRESMFFRIFAARKPSLSFKTSLSSFRAMVSTTSTNLDQARASVVTDVAFDILKATQDVDNERQRKLIARSFISDTITAPSKEMYAYAIRAGLGDDVYEETSTQSLEQHIAKICGKEAALFLTSGTLSNQLALRTHLTQPPYSVVCDERSHTYAYEAGGTALHSGATTIPISPSNGHHLTLDEIKRKMILGDDVHFAPTRVVQLENTLNGTIFPQDEIIEIADYVHSLGLKLHLDGARLWHVAAETGTSMKELCEPFDSISVCFSKGLGAPIGSCLVGSQEFIKKARWFRKAFGAGMRQISILSASAAYALTHNFPQLFRVHELARRLEAGLKDIGAEILSPAETCMVFYDPSPLGVSFDEIGQRGAQLAEPITLAGSRLVVHIQTEDKAVDDFLDLIRRLAEEKKVGGWVRPEKTESNGIKEIYVRRKATRVA